jgi:plasmid stability protein
MKNITVTVDDELYRRARVRAAEEATTVSSVVREQLQAYVAGPSEAVRREEARKRSERLQALFDATDAELAGKGPFTPPEPGWRDRLYDERFDNSKLGRSLKQHGR